MRYRSEIAGTGVKKSKQRSKGLEAKALEKHDVSSKE